MNLCHEAYRQDAVCGRLAQAGELRTAYSAAWVRSATPSLASTELTCVFTVFSDMCSRRAISLLDRPSAIWASTSRSSAVSESRPHTAADLALTCTRAPAVTGAGR